MKILNSFHPYLYSRKALRRSLMVAIAIGVLSTACSGVNTATSPTNEEAKAQIQTKTQPNQSMTPAMTDKAKPAQHGMNHGMNHSEMSLGIADENYDLRFVDAMIPHHEGAVIMAKAVLEKSQRPELKKMAQEIIQAQKQEIAQMKQWRKDWYPKASDKPMAWHKEMNHMMEMLPEQMSAMRMEVDLGAADADFELRFIEAMIPHHEGAVVMAKDALEKSKRSEITKLSKEIISSQQAEIEQMKQWRKAWYSK
ncbi:DUF305 domain-containing protein [Pseudanabaena sp. FACHB-1998]|uniref:DUF305 domain-containing protein n=1 Tax=Pseudanabaena sp. FACHB-1998 TaxID=2692858 RepID=UPI00168081B6|nr:DUF305 domain-containing protein [Pseudanabaena sp. FACHB-1998]MBD2177621.1 DUF305 domain-containing protein [Pseudanabaena sp. FACHB-1998]